MSCSTPGVYISVDIVFIQVRRLNSMPMYVCTYITHTFYGPLVVYSRSYVRSLTRLLLMQFSMLDPPHKGCGAEPSVKKV